jgi:hypothetical protein
VRRRWSGGRHRPERRRHDHGDDFPEHRQRRAEPRAGRWLRGAQRGGRAEPGRDGLHHPDHDQGTITAVGDDSVTVKEGAATVTYKTVTLAVGAGAKITLNGRTVALSKLEAGDHVR